MLKCTVLECKEGVEIFFCFGDFICFGDFKVLTENVYRVQISNGDVYPYDFYASDLGLYLLHFDE